MFTDTQSQLETINEIFETAKKEDGWNFAEPMLYSFYFVDEDADKLEKLGERLESEDYDFVGIFELGDEESGEATGEYLLHVDKVETHTPESLAQRNVELQRLADEHEVETYDGWEVGEVGDEDEEEEE
jgi:hypothetical protein